MASDSEISDIEIDKLFFDFENPRLSEFGVSPKTSQFELLKILWDNLAVREVAMSIAHNGYFRNEPLFVEDQSKNRFVVIEGNRRLAAVQLLLDKDLRRRLKATDLPEISSERRKELSKLPVLHTTRKEAWSQLGFKHVNGPATWAPTRRLSTSRRFIMSTKFLCWRSHVGLETTIRPSSECTTV